MELILSQLKFDKNEIMILGLVKLGNTLNLEFLAGIVTYTVYLMQFQILENNKKGL